MILPLDELPGPQADLHDLVRFAAAHDPTPEFQAEWGAAYAARARELWESHRAVFVSGAPLPDGDSIRELLLCMNYQIAAAPYLPVSADEVKALCHWLVGGMRYLILA